MNIYRLTLGGSVPGRQSRLSQITNEDADDRAPSLSARGDKLAYLSHRNGEDRVWVKDLSSGREWVLASANSDYPFPKLAPDGSKVAYGAGEGGVLVVPATGGRPTEVCNDCPRPSSWSPDGVWLLYSTSGGIGILNTETRQKSRLITSSRYSEITDAAFSADGHWIAFQGEIEKTRRQIIVVPFRGTEVEVKESEWILISDGQHDDYNPVWSPAGNMLYFVSERDGGRHIYCQQLDPVSKHQLREAFPLFGKWNSDQPSLGVGDPAYLGLSAANGTVVFAGTRKTASLFLTKLRD